MVTFLVTFLIILTITIIFCSLLLDNKEQNLYEVSIKFINKGSQEFFPATYTLQGDYILVYFLERTLVFPLADVVEYSIRKWVED